MQFAVKDLIEINGEPWVRLVVIGQSFLLHQIRKMVGIDVASLVNSFHHFILCADEVDTVLS